MWSDIFEWKEKITSLPLPPPPTLPPRARAHHSAQPRAQSTARQSQEPTQVGTIGQGKRWKQQQRRPTKEQYIISTSLHQLKLVILFICLSLSPIKMVAGPKLDFVGASEVASSIDKWILALHVNIEFISSACCGVMSCVLSLFVVSSCPVVKWLARWKSSASH